MLFSAFAQAQAQTDDVAVAPSEAPNTTPLPYNPPTPTNPLLQQQNGISTTSFNGSESAGLLTPNLSTTGSNGLAQVATNAALNNAFNQELTPEYESEETPHGPIDRILLGPITLKAVLATNIVEDDNIRGDPSGPNKLNDTTYAITPAIMLEYGNQPGQKASASLVYSPTITRFLKHSNENSDDQNVSFSAQYPFQRMTLTFSQTYSQTSGLNNDLSSRTTQTNSVTNFGGSYDIDDKLSFISHFTEVVTTFSQGGGIGGDSSTIDAALAYRLTEKITVGPGVNVGYESPQGGPRQTFEQGLMEISYAPTERIHFFTQAGLEFRQYHQGGDNTDPIFSAGLGYSPFDSTSLSLNASESVRSSTSDSTQSVVTTGVGFTATQRFLHQYYFGFSFTYNHADYQNNSGGAGTTEVVNGTQDDLLYRPSLTFNPTAWTSVGLYYQYAENLTKSASTSYHDNQAGFSVSAQF